MKRNLQKFKFQTIKKLIRLEKIHRVWNYIILGELMKR